MIDNLGGRLGSFDRLEKELSPGRLWSNFDRAIGAGAFFGDRSDDVREEPLEAAPERRAA
jgi:3'-5' exoribonuclease